MKNLYLQSLPVTLGAAALAAAALAVPTIHAALQTGDFVWDTVVNNTDLMPTQGCSADPNKCKAFNSYNQPSVNVNGLVVIRARSRGGQGETGGHEGEAEPAAGDGGEGGSGTDHGNQPVHGIYTRNMGGTGSPIVRILDRKTEVPQPNNAHYPPTGPLTTFIETPSFPRIDMRSATVATRGNHQPVWVYGDTRAGTTGIYTNPFGDLITGASKLGAVPGFGFFAVPGAPAGTPFDVFPGAPAVTGRDTIVFKGNYTVGGAGSTGVFFRNLTNADAGGSSPVVLIANNTDTEIPDTNPPVKFGSTSPPSAASGKAVFAGFDNEQNPRAGGIYLAPLEEYDPANEQPDLTPLVEIGDEVPGERKGAVFNRLGEGVAFDGRYVGFWGAWGSETRTVELHCPMEGNPARIEYCSTQCEPDGCMREVPVNQGIFVHDTVDAKTRAVAKTGARFEEFLFWNFSGMVPGVGGGEDGSEEDGEPARWRSSAFVAVSGQRSAFKGVVIEGEQGPCASCHEDLGATMTSTPEVLVHPIATPSPNARKRFHTRLVGVYLNQQPGQDIFTLIDTRTDGQSVDPEAPMGSTVTEVGLEREGLRGNWLAISAKMAVAGGTEEDGMAGVYITRVPR